VVHRDLKPENIFLVPTAVGDQVKVLDFGISKLSDSNTVQTTESVLIGTPLYMSPEQAQGHNSEVGSQSDLFSLGSICYELFTGRAPFQADNIAKVVFRIAYEKHPPLRSLRPDLPAAALAAVEHALEKDRERRTRDIDTFVLELTGQALAEVAQDETSGVYTPGMPETPSMSGGATRSPSGGGAYVLATPRPGSPPSSAAPPAPAKTISGTKLIVALVSGALVISAVVVKVRTDNWKERAAYQAGMMDAGYQLLSDGNFIPRGALMDAGASTPLPEAARDAGVAIDAAVAAPVPTGADAGSVEVVLKPKVPTTPAEEALLASLSLLHQQEKWETLWEERGKIRTTLQTPSARERGLSMIIDAACGRMDNAQLKPIVGEYRTVATAAQVRAARQRCIKQYPSSEFLDW
jgi:serine/threonine-protein kinase